MNIGDQVQVTIKTVDDMGYLVNIDAYNVEGFISLSDAHRKRASVKNRLIVGNQYMASIVRMNNGFCDLRLVNRG